MIFSAFAAFLLNSASYCAALRSSLRRSRARSLNDSSNADGSPGLGLRNPLISFMRCEVIGAKTSRPFSSNHVTQVPGLISSCLRNSAGIVTWPLAFTTARRMIDPPHALDLYLTPRACRSVFTCSTSAAVSKRTRCTNPYTAKIAASGEERKSFLYLAIIALLNPPPN
jgi:hypothetical protein